MQLLDLTLPTPAENLALDEALLEDAESRGGDADEVLRLWESPQLVAVVGRSSRVADEVDEDECRRRHVPVLRRASGGASIVAGPGCLMYAVVLSYRRRPQMRLLDAAHRTVMQTLVAAIQPLAAGVRAEGTSDLAFGERKFSGNSLRCKRDFLLYHGTLLYDFPIDLIGRLLRPPPRQPDYRRGRGHDDFVGNLPVAAPALRTALRETWNADSRRTDWPRERTEQLVQLRYTLDDWNRRL